MVDPMKQKNSNYLLILGLHDKTSVRFIGYSFIFNLPHNNNSINNIILKEW